MEHRFFRHFWINFPYTFRPFINIKQIKKNSYRVKEMRNEKEKQI